jgi:hypothetical protein
MKYLKKFESLTYSGGDVTKMPIIGKLTTKEIGPFKKAEYDVVEIINVKGKKVYVANFWYKSRIPQLLHEDLVEEFIPTKVKCKCGWSWDMLDGGKDPYTCHKCGHVNKEK